MKVDISKYFSTPGRSTEIVPIFFIKALCKLPKEQKEAESLKYKQQNGVVDIQFSVNGVDFPFEETLGEIYNQLLEVREEIAAEMCKERLRKIDELFESLKEKFQKDFGLEKDD